jgi:hypothetical protein
VEVRGEVERLEEGSARRTAVDGNGMVGTASGGARKGTTKAKRDWLLERPQRLKRRWNSPERRRVAAPALSPPLKQNRGDDRSNRCPIPV